MDYDGTPTGPSSTDLLSDLLEEMKKTRDAVDRICEDLEYIKRDVNKIERKVTK